MQAAAPAAAAPTSTAGVVLVLPSLKVSGGVKEALHLADDLAARALRTEVVSLWRSPHPVDPPQLPVTLLSAWPTRISRAPLQLPVLARRFSHWLRSSPRVHAVFTHYSTLPLAFLLPRGRRWVFVQDLEWQFLAQPAARAVLRWLILAAYRRCRLVAANDYLKAELQGLGLVVEADAPIWAAAVFAQAVEPAPPRDIDLLMVLRKGAHKRLDLYLQLLQLLQAGAPPLRVAVISPEDDIAQQAQALATTVWLRPDLTTMRMAYARSRCFVHLSEHEGFGLPPLEAMGAGCVPYCRDSGGVRAYMTGELRSLIVPRSQPIKAIAEDLRRLLADTARLAGLSAAARAGFQLGLQRASAPGRQLAACIAGGA